MTNIKTVRAYLKAYKAMRPHDFDLEVLSSREKAIVLDYVMGVKPVVTVDRSGTYVIGTTIEFDKVPQAYRDTFMPSGMSQVCDVKISTIKLVRNVAQLSLLDAKRFVEGGEQQFNDRDVTTLLAFLNMRKVR